MQVQICLSDNMHLLEELVSKLLLSLIYSISTNLFERGKTSLFKFGKNQFSIHHYFKWSCKKHIHNKGTISKQLAHCWKFKNCPLSKKKEQTTEDLVHYTFSYYINLHVRPTWPTTFASGTSALILSASSL